MYAKHWVFLLLSFNCSMPALGWVEFKSAKGRFSVDFPGKPKTTPYAVAESMGQATGQCFLYSEPTAAYLVFYVDYPKNSLALMNPDEMLRETIRTTARKINGKVVNESTASLSGLGGRKGNIVVSRGGAQFKATLKACLVKDRAYCVLVVVQEGKSVGPTSDKFLESFRLLTE